MLDRRHGETAQEAGIEPVALGQEQREIVRLVDGFADVNGDVRRCSGPGARVLYPCSSCGSDRHARPVVGQALGEPRPQHRRHGRRIHGEKPDPGT